MSFDDGLNACEQLAHDARASLGVIHGCATTLRSKGERLPPAERTIFLEAIARSAADLLVILDDLIEASQAGADDRTSGRSMSTWRGPSL